MKRRFFLVISLVMVFVLAVPLFAQTYNPLNFKSKNR